MGRGLNKAQRLQEMERLYLQKAFSDKEIAERLGVDRSTVFRDRLELESEIPFSQDDDGQYRIDRTHYLSNIRLNLNEALSLYLAARRASQQTRMAHQHVATALEKLAQALRQPMTNRLVLSAERILAQENMPERVKILETIAHSWVEGVPVRLEYQGLKGRQILAYEVKPYLIEPSPWSDGVYLIGESDRLGGVGVFKIERIQSATLMTGQYTIPEDFDEEKLLQYAWGIWFGENEPMKVRLRFSPGVAAKRLRESRWHPTESVEALEDGGCIWEAQVAVWEEMLPWVRGWGADVEVLEPEELREAVKKDVRKMARLYQTGGHENIPTYFYLWAKAEKDQSPDIHPLIYHLLDVGESTLALWTFALSEKTRQTISNALGLDTNAAGRLLSFWAALHDLGKAAPGFQRKYEMQINILEKAGFTFPLKSQMSIHPALHGVISSWALTKLLVDKGSLHLRDASRVAIALGGHHGTWPTSDRLQPPALQSSDKGDQSWDSAREQIFLILQDIYQPAGNISLPKNLEECHALLTLFTGLVSVADWIGSMEDNFPFDNDYSLPKEYAQTAAKRAKIALEKLGWIGWKVDGNSIPFEAMFQATPIPNTIQQKTFASALEYPLPALAILEAPTGIGKTEAALFLADAWLQRHKGSGIYVAMPTQATSNQMYERVTQFLTSRYPDQRINIHLVHGGALLAEDDNQLLKCISQDNPEAEATVRAESWFLPRKRTLLAPFGVGTVDQALMSVLQTRHFFVRLFGLSQKVVIFDEIHAYDTYMSELFQRLLIWLRSIGTSAILLSATLPEKTRRALVAAWLGRSDEDFVLPATDYPRLTLAGYPDEVHSIPLPPPPPRILNINWIDAEPEQIAIHLADRLAGGGCAAVICNRVQRAQEVYSAIKNVIDPDHLILFHARFPFAWRKEIEDRVLELFSKKGNRPEKFVVVATQVIEQSLDLDFDYIVSDLAPVDLLLQRAGRLHRHPRNDPNRPEKLQKPVITLAKPAEKDGYPDFGSDSRIYDQVTLLRTWLTIQNKHQIILPQETAVLIETVYPIEANNSQFDPEYQAFLQKAADKAIQDEGKKIFEAKKRLIARPDYEDLLKQSNDELEEDDPRAGDAFRALTRLGDPGISLICLHRTSEGIAIDPSKSGELVDLSLKLDKATVKKLLRFSVSVQRKDVVNYYLNHDSRTTGWKKTAALRDHFPVFFDANGLSLPDDAGFVLKLSRELGLEVFRATDFQKNSVNTIN